MLESFWHPNRSRGGMVSGSGRKTSKRTKNTEFPHPSGTMDMQSEHACACFVRVGRRRRGSILGSILVVFCEPSSPLYSFLVAMVTKTGLNKSISKSCVCGGLRPVLGPLMSGSRAPRDTDSRADNIHTQKIRNTL